MKISILITDTSRQTKRSALRHWNFNRGPIISDAEKRARAIITDKERDKKRCRLIGHDRHKAREPIIIIASVNPRSCVA